MNQSESVELTSDTLATSVLELLELAAQFEQINNADPDDFDAGLYQDLSGFEGTRTLLGNFVNELHQHRAKRHEMINTARVVRLVAELVEKFPNTTDMPEDSVALVKSLAAGHGLELSDAQSRKVVDAARRPGNDHAERMFCSIALKPLSQRTLSDIIRLLKSGETDGAGKIKDAAQLGIAWYEGAGATACLSYVLSLLDAPRAASAALSAWNSALQRQPNGEPESADSPSSIAEPSALGGGNE